MEDAVLVALIAKFVDEKVSRLPILHGLRGIRGVQGPQGEAGQDFVFSEHEEKFRQFAKEYAIRFSDLSADEIAQLKGPRGRDGIDGKSFVFSEHVEEINSIVRNAISEARSDLKLKFSDLTDNEKNTLRGPQGNDGRDGQDFNFDDLTAEQISMLRGPRGRDGVDGRNGIDGRDGANGIDGRDGHDFNFDELNEDQLAMLRGPRGRDGRDGHDFNFEEHVEFFQSLRPKFSDFTEEEKQSLKLRFDELTEEEKASLKLRFSDLNEEDLLSIRGPRGAKGQKGKPGRQGDVGEKGDRGPRGPRGLPGPTGIRGLSGINGIDGEDGEDGEDAPCITAIDLEQTGNKIELVFHFSDGSFITTGSAELPEPKITVNGGTIVKRGGSMPKETRIDEASGTVTYVGKAEPGSATDQSVWQIQRITVTGTETAIEWSNGNAGYVNDWDNRASLDYS